MFLDFDSFSTIKKTFESNEMISIAQPRILDYNNQDKYEYAGASGGYLDFLGYPFCREEFWVILRNLINTTQQGKFLGIWIKFYNT